MSIIMAGKLVTIATFSNYIEAELAKQKLGDYGIEAVVVGDNAANVYSVPTIAEVGLQVFDEKAKEASDIISRQ